VLSGAKKLVVMVLGVLLLLVVLPEPKIKEYVWPSSEYIELSSEVACEYSNTTKSDKRKA
jgi:hypothetical protein